MDENQKRESPKGFKNEWLLFLAEIAWEVAKAYFGL
jgi:hypothetical protein